MDIDRKQWRKRMKQWTSGKVWKFPFVCSSYFPGVQPFNLSVTSWDVELSFFPLCAVCPIKYWITYFSPHIFPAFLMSTYKILNYLLFPPTLPLLFPHMCPPVLQGQISILKAVCFSTAWMPWGQGLFPWSIKCYVLATGRGRSEEGEVYGPPCWSLVNVWGGLAHSELWLQMCLAELYWFTVASPVFITALHCYTPFTDQATEAWSRKLPSLCTLWLVLLSVISNSQSCGSLCWVSYEAGELSW